MQRLFDAAEVQVEQIRQRTRKGSLQALRNAVLLKAVYAFGLRRSEAVGLDLSDLRVNPKAADYGRFGGVFIRWAKVVSRRPTQAAHRADGARDGLDRRNSRPLPGGGPAVFRGRCSPRFWLTERCGAPLLFPGFSDARPLHSGTFGARLLRYGITPHAGRNTAMVTLAADLPATVVADLLRHPRGHRYPVGAPSQTRLVHLPGPTPN